MTLAEPQQLSEPSGFQPFAVVTQGGLRMEVPHPEFIDIPPDGASFVVVYITGLSACASLDLLSSHRPHRIFGLLRNSQPRSTRPMKAPAASGSSFIEPMKALLVRELPAGDWLYEMKFDGYRALAFKSGSEVRLVSRNQTSFNKAYPQLVDALKLLPAKSAIIDGEITALDKDGRSSFQLLQAYGKNKESPLVYYAFDLVGLEEKDLRERPLVERRKLVAKLLKKAPHDIRFSEELRGTRAELLEVARRFGLEGLVAKRPNSVYESGRRSGAWVKLKLTQEQEFVIGGYTQPEGTRKYFGSLLVGYYEANRLLFSGRVGTGFSEKLLKELYDGLQKIRRDSCPFVNLPEKRRGRWGQGITPAVMKRCAWVKPVLVAQIKFTEWTLDHQIRQPVFLGLRTDKDPEDVVRE